ncbi:hypothetical protein HDU92_003540 [Lobulomyces angularis]|nr:hypothetical protein HDU92_003540 [Lobulomyces angularis]
MLTFLDTKLQLLNMSENLNKDIAIVSKEFNSSLEKEISKKSSKASTISLIQYIPNEILPKIFENLKKKKDVFSCCLVNRRWLKPAQMILWRSIEIEIELDSRKSRIFGLLKNNKQNSVNFTKRIKFDGGVPLNPSAKLFSLFPNVKYLDFYETYVEKLELIFDECKSLSNLDFGGLNFDFNYKKFNVEELKRLTYLKKNKIDNIKDGFAKLKSLKFKFFEFRDYGDQNLLENIFIVEDFFKFKPLLSIQYLELPCYFLNQAKILSKHFSYLIELKVYLPPENCDEIVATLVSSAKKLKKLVLYGECSERLGQPIITYHSLSAISDNLVNLEYLVLNSLEFGVREVNVKLEVNSVEEILNFFFKIGKNLKEVYFDLTDFKKKNLNFLKTTTQEEIFFLNFESFLKLLDLIPNIKKFHVKFNSKYFTARYLSGSWKDFDFKKSLKHLKFILNNNFDEATLDFFRSCGVVVLDENNNKASTQIYCEESLTGSSDSEEFFEELSENDSSFSDSDENMEDSDDDHFN